MATPQRTSTSAGRRIGLLRVAYEQAALEILEQVASRHPELRPAHLQLFREAGIDGASAAELAAHAGITKQSMHELVVHLERHGYLTRGADPGDSRTKLLRLTDSGRELERHIHAAVAGVHASWEERLGSDRFQALWATLRELTSSRSVDVLDSELPAS